MSWTNRMQEHLQKRQRTAKPQDLWRFEDEACEDMFIARVHLSFPERTMPWSSQSRSKKAARQDAARIAFEALTSEENPENLSEKSSNSSQMHLNSPQNIPSKSKLCGIAQAEGWTAEFFQSRLGGPDHDPRFEVSIHLCDRLIAREQGPSVKYASEMAASAALQTFSTEPPSPHGDRIAEMVLNKWVEVASPRRRAAFSKTVLAGFVQTNSITGEMETICVAAGTAHSPHIRSSPSEYLRDCHAEVLAHRLLQRYFHDQLSRAQKGDPDTIFEPSWSRGGDAYRVMWHIQFHLFISAMPCGDACCQHQACTKQHPCIPVACLDGRGPALPMHSEYLHWPVQGRETQGKLRAKLDNGESLTPVPLNSSRYGSRMRKMSCSDKILKWNALGIQGSLLSHLIEPVYLNSVTISSDHFSHGDLTRSLCCRLRHLELPPPYTLHHPTIQQATFVHPEFTVALPGHSEACSASSRAACWLKGEADIEVIADAKNGVICSFSPGYTTLPGVAKLHEFAQMQLLCEPQYNIDTDSSIPPFTASVEVAGTSNCVTAHGTGNSIQEAKHAAAEAALRDLFTGMESMVSGAQMFESFCKILADRDQSMPHALAVLGTIEHRAAKLALLQHFEEHWQQQWLRQGTEEDAIALTLSSNDSNDTQHDDNENAHLLETACAQQPPPTQPLMEPALLKAQPQSDLGMLQPTAQPFLPHSECYEDMNGATA